MSNNIWDDPSLQQGDYVQFETPGDTFTGTITAIEIRTFDDGKKAPELTLADGNGELKKLTAGAYRLKQALLEQRPKVNDQITVTYLREEPIGGGKKVRHWDLKVVPGPAADPWAQAAPQGPAAPLAPLVGAPAAGPAGPDPQAVAAALNALTPEQRAALGLG